MTGTPDSAKCTHDPRKTKGPVGMYHCPVCGEMVLAGEKHIDWDSPDDSPCNSEEDEISDYGGRFEGEFDS